jgi:hypothetical protein
MQRIGKKYEKHISHGATEITAAKYINAFCIPLYFTPCLRAKIYVLEITSFPAMLPVSNPAVMPTKAPPKTSAG